MSSRAFSAPIIDEKPVRTQALLDIKSALLQYGPMPKVPALLRQTVFILMALLAALFLQLRSQTAGFSFRAHHLAVDIGHLLLSAAILYVFLVGLWALSAHFLGRASGLLYKRSLDEDFWTWSPLLFLALSPLALKHYLTRDDLADRLGLWLTAVLLAVLCLKIGRWLEIGRTTPMVWTPLQKRFLALPPGRKLPLLFLAAVLVYNAGAALMMSNGQAPGGDEPHYLLVTQSLLADGDFDVANNYEQRDYHAYLPPRIVLQSHTVPGAKPGSLYSFHSPGVSIYLLPFAALSKLFGPKSLVVWARLAMSLIGALFGLQIYLLARREFGRERLALGLWALTGFTAPIFFYSIHIYPEIFAALFSLLVFRLLRDPDRLTAGRLVLCGVLLPALVWFHALKYLFLIVPLGLYAFWVLWKKRAGLGAWAAFIGPAAVVGALYFAFQLHFYGSLNPTAVSWQGAMDGRESLSFLTRLLTGIPFRFRLETLAGYFFDQRDGLLFYAPIYFFSFLGLLDLIKRRWKTAALILGLSLPYVLVSAFLTQRTGYAPQARPLVGVAWALAFFCGVYLAAEAKRGFTVLFRLAVGWSLLAVWLLLQNPLALYQETTQGTMERSGELFTLLSNFHHSLPRLLPSFLKIDEWKWAPNFVWPLVLAVFLGAYALARAPKRTLKFGHLLVGTGLVLGFVFAWFVFLPRLALGTPRPAVLADGETLSFYGLSRVARMHAPARFSLLEDGRDYNFYFSSPRRIDRLGVVFGSEKGDYDLDLGFFDDPTDRFPTRRALDRKVFKAPPAYRWKKSYLYRISIHLEKKSDVKTGLDPYQFALEPVR